MLLGLVMPFSMFVHNCSFFYYLKKLDAAAQPFKFSRKLIKFLRDLSFQFFMVFCFHYFHNPSWVFAISDDINLACEYLFIIKLLTKLQLIEN